MMGLDVAVAAGIALVAGPLVFIRGFRTMRTRRLIANTPTSHIRSMAMGLVEINGNAEPRSRVTAPFSGHDCLYWEVEIAAEGRRGWSVIHRNQSGQPFFIQDGTGAALVYPHGARCTIAFSSEEIIPGMELPEAYADYMKANVSAFQMMSRLGQLRFRERVIEEGSRLFVLGTATPRAQEQVVAEGELLQATGTTDVRAIPRREVLDQETVAVVRRGENESTFIISQESGKTVEADLGFRQFFQLTGGPIITLFGLAYWLAAWSSGHKPWSR
jgi:hypothetical protein